MYPSTSTSKGVTQLTYVNLQVIPVAISINNTRNDIPHYLITNTGSQRFDVYAGPFTKNDQYTVTPYKNGIQFIANVTVGDAKQVLDAMNEVGEQRRREFVDEVYGRGYVEDQFRDWLRGMARREGPQRREAGNVTLGYVTKDVSHSSHAHLL